MLFSTFSVCRLHQHLHIAHQHTNTRTGIFFCSNRFQFFGLVTFVQLQFSSFELISLCSYIFTWKNLYKYFAEGYLHRGIFMGMMNEIPRNSFLQKLTLIELFTWE